MTAVQIQQKLRKLGDEKRAKASQRFFKTGPGEYGEGDVFLGISVPKLRKLAKEYKDLSLKETRVLLRSSIHEARLLSLFILIGRFVTGDESEREKAYNLYLNNTRFINNWDLVDASAGQIVGAFLADKEKAPLYRLAASKSLWERRVAIISTFYFIRQDAFSETLKISERLLSDKEDLIHKAVGWMLREVGKRDLQTEEKFLKRHYKKMPRTMLRYAIERFPEPKRQDYLKGRV
jgi:3-methyladenine DNA glycosylase AlkD